MLPFFFLFFLQIFRVKFEENYEFLFIVVDILLVGVERSLEVGIYTGEKGR